MDSLPELLAPAGSFDAAVAALSYGADAIYLGLDRFSARADAANFDDTALRQVVAYAHNLRRKVYVTLNTLVETRELADLREPLALLDELAVDGVIVQDLGLAAWMRRAFPRLPLHASTQLACTSLAGARALKALGFVRIVTARELGLREAAEIGRRAGVEIEVFVHGALCYSLSGLCLYSSLTTGRSGNRGRCAYCCRQPFRPEGSDAPCHPFSMRDLALLGQADLLRALPLASLKIEGRMKNPLYVAAVTDLYRRLLDGALTPADRRAKTDDLRTLFSRPWTTLHALGQAPSEAIIDARSVGHRGLPIGRVLRVVRDIDGLRWLAFDTARPIERHDGLQIDLPGRPLGFPVDRLRDARTKRPAITLPAGARAEVALPREVGDVPRGATVCHAASQAVRRAFPIPRPRAAELRALRPADLTLTLAPDALTLAGGGVRVSFPATLTPAQNPAGTRAAAERHLGRLGEDGFALRSLTLEDNGLFAPPSLLNAARRQWAAQANASAVRDEPPPAPEAATPRRAPLAEPHWILKASALQHPTLLGDEPPHELILTLPADADEALLAPWLRAFPRERLRIALPLALRDADLGPMAALVGALADRGLRRFECADLTSWQLLRDLQPTCDAFDITADWTWYAANAEAVRLQHACDLTAAATGFEANLPNLLTLPDNPPREILVAGYAPLFIACAAPLLPHPDGARLTDRSGLPLRVTRIGRHWVTFCERPWSAQPFLPELLRASLGRLRADLSWAGAALPLLDWRDLLRHPSPLPTHFATPRL